MWKGWEDDNGETVNGTTVIENFDKYKYYYMALDYIAFFSMITNFDFNTGTGNYINDNQRERLAEKIDNIMKVVPTAKRTLKKVEKLEEDIEKIENDKSITKKERKKKIQQLEDKMFPLLDKIDEYERLNQLDSCHVDILQHLLDLMDNPMYVKEILNMKFEDLSEEFEDLNLEDSMMLTFMKTEEK